MEKAAFPDFVKKFGSQFGLALRRRILQYGTVHACAVSLATKVASRILSPSAKPVGGSVVSQCDYLLRAADLKGTPRFRCSRCHHRAVVVVVVVVVMV